MEFHGNIQAAGLIALTVYALFIILKWRRKKFENRLLIWGFAGKLSEPTEKIEL